MTPRAGLFMCLLGVAALAACATVPPAASSAASPRYPDYPVPDIPAALAVAPDVRDRHEDAWRRLQGGDLRGAAREFTAALAADPNMYPAETGLGFVRLAERQFEQAAARFRSAADRNADYLPAWRGRVQAELSLGRDAEAIDAIERVLALDPAETALRSQLDLLRFRELQSLIDAGRRFRQQNRYPDAVLSFERALALSPSSGVLHRELAVTEAAAGSFEEAESHARRAIALDANDAEAHAVLAAVLEEAGRVRDAADEYGRAIALDPRPEWRQRRDRLTASAERAGIPPEFRDVPTATTLTRAQAAAYIGTRLDALIQRAPRRVTEVATDIRGHWAAQWILPVTQAGVMEIFPNHTFQPAQTLRRGDLARVVAQLLALNPLRRMDLLRWQAMKPDFADLPASNLFYDAAAVAVSSGAMSARPGNRFAATDPATGPDLVEAIVRIEQIGGR
jgi:tetratricopeptide (TPR) repeat protein